MPACRHRAGARGAGCEDNRMDDGDLVALSASELFSVIRTVRVGRPASARWEVVDGAGRVVGVVAEERRAADSFSTFTVIHNPTGVPFRPPPGRRLRALGVWMSSGHATVPGAVTELWRHFAEDQH